MISFSSVGASALFLLQQRAPEPSRPSTPAPNLVAVAAGEADQTGEDYFGSGRLDATSMKVRMMERLGEAFGIQMEDHETASEFGAAIARVYGELKLKPEGARVLAQVEKDLGLDKLGISIDTLVGAIVDPAGAAAARLDAALSAQVGGHADEEEDAAAILAGVLSPELKLYQP